MRDSEISHGFFSTRTSDCQPKQKLQDAKVDFPPSELREAMPHLAETPEELSVTPDNYRDP
jgi:hypothetical protein